jgi:pimeloyl-ACP methyl ester carboxylesterase
VVPAGRVDEALFSLVRWPKLAVRLLARPPRALGRFALREAVGAADVIDEALVGHYLALARQAGFAHACVSTARHWREWVTFRPRMGEIRQPTVLIWGESDRIHPIRQAGLLRTLIPQAGFLALPCGHLPQLECPAEVNAALAELLGEGSS